MSTRKRKTSSQDTQGKEAPELPFSPKSLRLNSDEKMGALNLGVPLVRSPKPSSDLLHHLVDSKFTLIYPTGVQVSPPNIKLLDSKADSHHAVTFDELTLADRPSNYHPAQVNLTSHITRNIYLKGCGFMSAAMDTVTEMNMALEMAKNGGIGILHRNMSTEEQVSQVKWVRRKIHFGGMVSKPITFGPELRYSEFQSAVSENRWPFTSFPVVDDEKKVLGLITRDQLEFVGDENPLMSEIMIPIAKIVTAPPNTISTDAYDIMHANKVKKLPVLDDNGCLQGMYVWNDVKADATKQNRFSLDKEGHFLVGAAIGVGAAELERADALVKAGCKLLVIDSSHGACLAVREIIQGIRERFGNAVEIIAGNVASYESAQYLLDNEAGRPDGIKVGIGPGSICTTRKVTGHGIPQITAIYEVWKAIRDYGAKTGYYVPIVADGGVKSSGDIVKALAAGANGIMMGSALAGALESPGNLIEKNGRKYKTIRGMGSRSAMEDRSGSRMRYFAGDKKMKENVRLTNTQAQKVVPEGVEGLVEYKGSVEIIINQLLGGIQSGLAHSGANSIATFQSRASFWAQSTTGLAEGNPHDITDVRH